VEVSTNLEDWVEIMRGIAGSARQTFTDGQAANYAQRFYPKRSRPTAKNTARRSRNHGAPVSNRL